VVACFGTDAANAAFAAANPYVITTSTGLPTASRLGCAAAAHLHLQQGPAERGRDVCGEFECRHLRQLFEGLAGAGHRQPLQLVLLPGGSSAAKPNPESTDNFDLGVRYRSGKLMAQVSTWYTIYQNRLASTFDRDLNTTIYRNLGRVDKYGIDGSISYSRYATWRSISMARTCTQDSRQRGSG
jgi:iron complex outermembrane receptor protein